jgi:hypothetical protein
MKNRDVGKRLKSLEARRKGTDRIGEISMESLQEVLAKSLNEESYSKRAPNLEHTRYALGSMHAVDPDYTKISIGEAERVQAQLQSGLLKKSINVEFRLQGSVACDLHIRGVSDVDLLTLDGRFYRYDTDGFKSKMGGYNNPVSFDTLVALTELRLAAEEILKSAFPAANVKTDSAKAINLTGGSLRRPVDVVPANWYDTKDYQLTAVESDRGVEILDKTIPARIKNMPFKHISRINQRDSESLGG